MKVEIIPAGNQTVARGATVQLAVTLTDVSAPRSLAAVTWTDFVNTSGFAGNVCKPSTVAGGYGNATALSEEILLGDTFGAAQCKAPAGLAFFGWASPSNTQRYGFRFLNTGSAEIVEGGTVLATVTCNAGATVRVTINNRVFTAYVNGTEVHQSGSDSANQCWYKASVSINTSGLCVGDCQIEMAQGTPDVGRAIYCVNWSTNGGMLTQAVGIENTWLAPLTSGTFEITASAVGVESSTISITTSGITAIPVGGVAGTVYEAVANTVVKLTGNGGSTATLTANGGTVIDSVTWLAPGKPDIYTLTYSNASETVTIMIKVVAALIIGGVDDAGIFDAARPGTCHHFQANLPETTYAITVADGVTTSTSDRMTTAGTFCALNDPDGDTFGTHTYTVIASNSGQTVTFQIIVDPVYPTPHVEGPEPVKWLPLTPKFATRSSENDLLCRQYAILADQPERRWSLDYQGLPLCSTAPVGTEVFCTNSETGPPRLGRHHYASRLDEFWALVRGEGQPFWFRDRDGQWHKGVHFVSMSRDHAAGNYEGGQTRKVELVNTPCCDDVALAQPC